MTTVPTGPELGWAKISLATHNPLPFTVKVYGFSLLSLLMIWMTAVRIPVAVGLNSMSNKLKSRGPIGDVGRAVIKKSFVSPLSTVTLLIVRSWVCAWGGDGDVGDDGDVDDGGLDLVFSPMQFSTSHVHAARCVQRRHAGGAD